MQGFYSLQKPDWTMCTTMIINATCNEQHSYSQVKQNVIDSILHTL